PHARLAVAGRVSERDVAHVSGVDVIGAVPEADKPGVYAGADVYVAPHRGGESMGLVLVEAMASATAVVATDLPAFRAVSGDGAAAALVPPRDPVALAEAIVRVLDDECYRTALIAAGQQRARDFDIATVLDQIEAVYRSV
ncbi:MAG: glycosyltransferase, partial [Actinobacteria bacterium]|nr:glycosyltransferase [Actinomycetota bacterium]